MNKKRYNEPLKGIMVWATALIIISRTLKLLDIVDYVEQVRRKGTKELSVDAGFGQRGHAMRKAQIRKSEDVMDYVE